MEEMIKEISQKISEVDILYRLLKKNGQGQSFRELMQQVCEIKGIPADNPQLMAAVHTQINLDNRFAFLGQGNWGLKEWSQNKINRRTITFTNSSGRTVPYPHRSLQDEMETGDNEYNNNYDNNLIEDEDEWEE